VTTVRTVAIRSASGPLLPWPRDPKTTRLKEKIAKEEMQRLHALEARMLATPGQQISLTDPDARSTATSGRGSGVVGYNVQVAVDAEYHLIITHEVTNVGTDRSQLAHVARGDEGNAVSDEPRRRRRPRRLQQRRDPGVRGSGHHVTLPKSMTSAFVLMHGFPDNLHIYDDLIPHLVAGGRRVSAARGAQPLPESNEQRAHRGGARPPQLTCSRLTTIKRSNEAVCEGKGTVSNEL
jgi:hypothetical protein